MYSIPKGDRPHIVFVGSVNAGKSTLFNHLLGQDFSVVSAQPGTTTDVVSKAIELHGIGPVVLIDTPGLDDCTDLGALRMEHTHRTLREADVILLLLSHPHLPSFGWIKEKYPETPILPLVTMGAPSDAWLKMAERMLGSCPLVVGTDMTPLLRRVGAILSERSTTPATSITGRLAKSGDLVLLVMPQDASAPKGRLILPQVQTIRDLLDKHCAVLSIQPSELSATLDRLKSTPDLIITDSQAFAAVEPLCPEGVPLTSFSVLMSAFKGNLASLLQGAKALENLSSSSRVLIAEACTHAPESEDIGTVKIPRLLRQRFGQDLRIDHISGKDFPSDLTPYDVIIHCGACMFNRQHLLSRQSEADKQSVPMTNYGIAIAHLLGILSRVALP